MVIYFDENEKKWKENVEIAKKDLQNFNEQSYKFHRRISTFEIRFRYGQQMTTDEEFALQRRYVCISLGGK